MNANETPEFQQRMQRVEALVQQLEDAADPAVRDAAREMVRALLELHGTGLARMIALLTETGEPGRKVIDACTHDELLTSLLALHDLHPQDLEDRVTDALEKVRPYLQSHGGDVELIELSEGVARLRLKGQCDGCPSSSATLKSTVEQAIHEAAPEIAAIEAEGDLNDSAATSGFVQLGLPEQTQTPSGQGRSAEA